MGLKPMTRNDGYGDSQVCYSRYASQPTGCAARHHATRLRVRNIFDKMYDRESQVAFDVEHWRGQSTAWIRTIRVTRRRGDVTRIERW